MASATTHDRELHCVVVTPERTLLDQQAEFVALPMYDGELGVLPGRTPLIGRLGHGELRIRREGRVERFYVDGGFVQVRSNVVTVLTPQALRAAEINEAAARQALEVAMAPAATPQAQDMQTRAQARARAQIRIAQHQSEDRG